MSINDSYEFIGVLNNFDGYGLGSPCGLEDLAAAPQVTCTLQPGDYELTLEANVSAETPFTVNLEAVLTGDFVITPEPNTGLIMLSLLTAFLLKVYSTQAKRDLKSELRTSISRLGCVT